MRRPVSKTRPAGQGTDLAVTVQEPVILVLNIHPKTLPATVVMLSSPNLRPPATVGAFLVAAQTCDEKAGEIC
jgi:hypothetical protein